MVNTVYCIYSGSNCVSQANLVFFLQPDATAGGEPSQSLSEEGSLDIISKGHTTMTQVLAIRSKNLQTVRVMWTSGNTKVLINA